MDINKTDGDTNNHLAGLDLLAVAVSLALVGLRGGQFQ